MWPQNVADIGEHFADIQMPLLHRLIKTEIDLSPLASLISLQSLNLTWCEQLSNLSPLAGLTALQSLDAELKLFILGNGGVGKTQLSRRLQDLDFDPEILTTHGIQLSFVKTTVNLEHFKGSERMNVWGPRHPSAKSA
jgi:hypothetical protein